jgi:uracil-DNA glycosylase
MESGFSWPDFAALGVTSHPSFGVGAVYRGRFRDVSLVVLADQASDDDLFTGRALSGEAGQRLERFLRAAGLTRRYLVVRTLPVDTLDLTQSRRNSLLDRPETAALHRELLRRVRAENPQAGVLLALGPGAQRLALQVVPAGMDVIAMAAAGASGTAASWQAALDQLATRTYPKDLTNPSFQLGSDLGQLPRAVRPDLGGPARPGAAHPRRTAGRRSALTGGWNAGPARNRGHDAARRGSARAGRGLRGRRRADRRRHPR